ncbi:hypothetical protein DIPPA_25678 [Diplonema papillatum]|nr:hypothetical protein DIPPA_11250 [Diplonema papillatum]KAJ9450122.1 hypothetical protein DIPPA_25678 [Diplonema papillatum]
MTLLRSLLLPVSRIGACHRLAQKRWCRAKAERAATDDEDDLEEEDYENGIRYKEPGTLSPFDVQWETAEHEALENLREKYFGRFAENLSFGMASANLQKEMKESVGDLQDLPHVVGVQPVVLKLTKIDELRQVATCEGLLIAKWYEPELAEQNIGAGVEVPVSDVRVPSFPRISTAIEQPEVAPPVVIHQRQACDAPGVVFCVWKWRADLEVEFGLKHFPFDTQLVNLVFWWNTFGHPSSPDLGRYALPYSCNARSSGTTLVRSLQSLSAEWHLFRPRVFAWNQSTRIHAGSALKGQNGRKQGILLEIPIARRYAFYLNMMRTMGLIASLAFCGFAAAPLNLGERLSSTFALLLSLIAFKFSVSDKLPKVAYMTRFDLYMHGSFALLGVLALHFTFMRLWFDYYSAHQNRDVPPRAVVEKPANSPATPSTPGTPACPTLAAAGGAAESGDGEVLWFRWLAEHDPVPVERQVILPVLGSVWVGFNVFMALHQRRLLHHGRAILGREIKPIRNYRASAILAQRWEQHEAVKKTAAEDAMAKSAQSIPSTATAK